MDRNSSRPRLYHDSGARTRMITVNDEIQIVSSSGGNQMKWKENNRWYKVDRQGNEGLAETIVSNLLCYTSCESFALYREETFNYHEHMVLGCSSENFLPTQCNLITVSRLFKLAYGDSPSIVCKGNNLETQMMNFVQKLSKLVSLSEREVGEYLTQMFELDALILNKDRHFNNIAFIQTGDCYIPAPLFDHGDSLLATDYTSGNLQSRINKIVAKPFLCDFSEQKEIMEHHFGTQLKVDFNKFQLHNFESKYYDSSIVDEMYQIIEIQCQKYPNLTKNYIQERI